jgi:hypothetical protein
MAKWLYVFKDPLGSGDVKIGITGNPKVRLSNYQNSYSARRHKACFDFVWEGKPKAIEKLESVLKEKYKWDIASDRMGESEWVTDLSIEDLIKVVSGEIKGWRFHIKVLDSVFPITNDDIE